MFVIMVYDVDVKRLPRVHKTAKRYLRWVQRSVFEGELTHGGFAALKDELRGILDGEHDSVAFYSWPVRHYVSCKGMGPCVGLAPGEKTNFL